MSNISYKHVIHDHELMLYPYAPLGLLHNQGKWPTAKYNLSIVISVSIEDKNLLEWLIYHQTLGVDHIYLYCTDEDPTDLYRQIIPFTLGPKPFITFHHYRFSKLKNQIYFHFIHNYIHETSWYISLDSTDFLHIQNKQTLSNFLNDFSKLDIKAIYFNIIFYQQTINKEQTTSTTIFQQNKPINYPYIHTKIMVRSKFCPYQYIFHNLDQPLDQHIDQEKIINQSSNVLRYNMKDYYKNFPLNAIHFMNVALQKQIIATAYIAHFCYTDDPQEEIDKFSILYAPDNNLNEKINTPSPFPSLSFTLEQYWTKIKKDMLKSSLFSEQLPFVSLLSRDKPCQQSSTPEQYDTADLAYTLANKELHGITQSITKKETNPWWEIDLEKSFVIKNIRLFNGIDLNIKNMVNFVIESSEDHETWIKRHHKTTLNLFGGVDGSYYNWIHPLGIRARWIRIMIPGDNKVFSLDHIQIFGLDFANFYIP